MTNPESSTPTSYPDLKRIEEQQALPEVAVVRFLSAEGAISGTSLDESGTERQLRVRFFDLYPGNPEAPHASP